MPPVSVCHVTVGRVSGSKSNGVLTAVSHLYRAQQSIAEVRCICIVRKPNRDAGQATVEIQMGLGLLRLVRRIACAQPTVFHLHGGLNPQLHFLGIFCAFAGIPYVVSPHGAFANRPELRPLWKRMYLRLVVRKYLEAASFTHTYGDFDTYWLDQEKIATPRITLPNGIDHAVLAHSVARPPRAPGGKLSIGYCGRLRRGEKGIELFSQILRVLERKQVDFVFHIVGDGPDRSWLEADLHTWVERRSVVFYGPLYSGQKLSVLNSVDVFIHPSRNEGMPLAPLEALAAGCRLVVSAATNLAPYIGHLATVTVLGHCQSEAWADAVVAAFRSESHDEKIPDALKEDLSWDRIAARFIEEYRR